MSNRTQREYEELNLGLRSFARHQTNHDSGLFSRMEPEQALAYAVLCRSILDLDATLNKGTAGAQLTGVDRMHAYIFCFSESGNWKRSRELWCNQAGVDVAGFERLAKRYMHLARSRSGCLTDAEFMAMQDEKDKQVARENSAQRKRKAQFAF